MNWQVYPWGQEKLQFLLDRVEAKKNRLTNLRPIPRIALENLRKSLMLEWTYHSNAIEGSTITLQETKIIVSDGLTVGTSKPSITMRPFSF
jgi:Fic family protein